MKKLFFFLAFVFLFNTIQLKAWIYPEHRDIALLAIKNLNENDQVILQELWRLARIGFEERLSPNVAEFDQSVDPQFIDFAAWPAISGDHSCSPANLLEVILESDWILNVADIAAKLKIDLAKSEGIGDRVNALRDSDSRFQRADPEYATRAGSNNVHFLLAILDIHDDLKEYIRMSTQSGAPLNAVGMYSFFHYSALQKAALIHSGSLTQQEKSLAIRYMLAEEAFALHFLQDVFAAGHVAGTWGTTSQRKGTHDYYNERGLRTSTWEGTPIIITGDAYMRNEDAERAASVIQISLEQVLNVVNGKIDINFTKILNEITSNDYSACANNFFTENNYEIQFIDLLENVISQTPIPGVAEGMGELPRFRAEIGLFGGFAPSLRGSLLNGGFAEYQEDAGLVGGIEAAIRFGVGLDGVLNEAGDGLAFLEFGWRQNGSSSNSFLDIEGGLNEGGAILSAIPARSGFGGRLRLPFYVIPGDLLISAPFLLIFSPETLTQMGVQAVNGGLIPWQTGFVTPFGKFQFVLGREIGLYFFGRSKYRDSMFQFGLDTAGELGLYLVSYRSTQIEFPILEYTPLRSYSFDQSSTLRLQLYGGIDIPYKLELIDADLAYLLELRNIWYIGVRLVFDWRYYF